MEMALKIAELETLPLSVLQNRWKEFFGTKCDSNNKEYYVSRIGTDIQSKVLAFAFGLSAEIERNLISQRTKEALARIKADGKHLG